MAKKKLDLIDIYGSDNVAEMLDQEQRDHIGMRVCEHFDIDKASRADDDKVIGLAMDVAKQVMKTKNTPWPNASNVKYPLITTAAIQFGARAYPEVIRNDKVILSRILGKDPDGSKDMIGQIIEDHMNFQLLVEDPEWEGELDRLLPCLSIVGTVFKKTYWDEIERRNRSLTCAPGEVVVNTNIKSIETARRITHVLPMYLNDIISRIRYDMFCDEEELLRGEYGDGETALDDMTEQQDVLEQHCYLDLDEDGYEEPYIVTVHYKTRKVLRIFARFELANIELNKKGKVCHITPTHYFTDFHFIPSPDGSFHSIGYGHLLYPINEVVNTAANQLINAGTASNMQSGFLGRGFKKESGSMFLTPGEWKPVDVIGDDLGKNIVPLPTRDPSSVLFQVMETMIQAGKEVASVTDIMQGQQPAQNVPATTVLALIEQSLKVYSAIQKRLYRSLRKEFSKLYDLNRRYLEEGYEFSKVGQTMQVSKALYQNNYVDIIPVSDPAISSDAQRMARAKALLEIIPTVSHTGGQIIIKNWLEALKTPDSQIDQIMQQDPQAPSPQQAEAALKDKELQIHQSKIMMQHEQKAHDAADKAQQTESQIALNQQLAAESEARIDHMRAQDVIAQEALKNDNIQAHVGLAIDAVNKMDDLQEEHATALKKAAKDSLNG